MADTVRIQKALSDEGIMSRRKAEEAVAQGRVTVNGHPAQPGNPVNIRKDVIAVDGQRVQFAKKRELVYLVLNKPRGYVTTTSDELGRKCVTELLADAPARVYPVGRLDRNSEGLLLFTNDGQFANFIMHPSHHIQKTYRVTVHQDVGDDIAVKLSTGVDIGKDGVKEMTAPASVQVLTKEQGRTVLQITIGEGKNRQVRRMCEAVGLEVVRLRRTSVGPLKLGMLAPGQWRELKPSEVGALRNSAKIIDPNASAPGEGRRSKAKAQALARGYGAGRPQAKPGAARSAAGPRPTGAKPARPAGARPAAARPAGARPEGARSSAAPRSAGAPRSARPAGAGAKPLAPRKREH